MYRDSIFWTNIAKGCGSKAKTLEKYNKETKNNSHHSFDGEFECFMSVLEKQFPTIEPKEDKFKCVIDEVIVVPAVETKHEIVEENVVIDPPKKTLKVSKKKTK